MASLLDFPGMNGQASGLLGGLQVQGQQGNPDWRSGVGNFLANNSNLLMALGGGLAQGGIGAGFQAGAEAGQKEQQQRLTLAHLLQQQNQFGQELGFKKTEAERAQGNTLAHLLQQQNQFGQELGFKKTEAERAQGNTERQLALQESPQFTTIGHDIASNPQYGFVNRLKSSVTSPTGGVPVGFPTGADGQPLMGQELLDHLKQNDPAAASTIQAIGRGDLNINPRLIQKYTPAAEMVYPDLSQINYDTRRKTNLAFAPDGKAGMNVKSLETVGGHLEKMLGAYDSLGNTWSPDYNSFKNWLAVKGGHGELKGFETAATGVANELGTVFRSSGMSDAEVKSWRDQISSANSPEAFKSSMSMLLDMLKTRKEVLQEQARTGGLRQDPATLFPKLDKAIATIDSRLSGKPIGAGSIVGKPGEAITGYGEWQDIKPGVRIREIR